LKTIIIATLYYCLRILDFAILAFCILSWVGRSNQKLFKIYSKLGYYLWPIMGPARWIISKIRLNIPVDFSPWLTMVLANFVYNILARIITIL